MDTVKIMTPAVHVQGTGDLDAQVKALTTCLADAVTNIAAVAAVVTEHAGHFALHHDGITWCVRDLRDLRAETTQHRQGFKARFQRTDVAKRGYLCGLRNSPPQE